MDKAVKKPTFDDPTEKIKLNQKFTSNNIRVNLIPTTSSKKKESGADENEQKANKEVNVERQVIIQATSVKIMKTRK